MVTLSTVLNGHAHTLQRWVERRRAKGIEPSADAIVERMRHNWPLLDDPDQERVFQRTAQIDAETRSARALHGRTRRVPFANA